jgi:hypothetical protein
MIVFSYGGGLQTVALCVLIREEILPRPDLIGIADTGREMPSTWEYLDGVVRPYLAPLGLVVEVVPHSLASRDLYGPDGLTLMPAYTRTEEQPSLFGGMEYADGRLPGYCSGHWKRDPMERWYRLKGVKECEQWLGFSIDEKHRAKGDHRPWCRNRFPLIEKGITREMCKAIIRAAGLPLPRKSRCWMCPHQDEAEWQEVKERPEVFAQAVALEKEINEADPDKAGTLHLWRGRVPLEMADFKGGGGAAMPPPPCEAGNCWT